MRSQKDILRRSSEDLPTIFDNLLLILFKIKNLNKNQKILSGSQTEDLPKFLKRFSEESFEEN